MAKTKTILRTEHGSHLYGLATPDSDLDTYEIYDFLNRRFRPRKQARQKIDSESNTDSTVVSLERFTNFCLNGVPQAVEVLYAPADSILYQDSDWNYARAEILERIDFAEVLKTYHRTAVRFMMDQDDFKRNRHAFRLCENAKQLKYQRTMNPRLEKHRANWFTAICKLHYKERLRYFYDAVEVFDDV